MELKAVPKFKKNNISGVGIGLRHRHFKEVLNDFPAIPWFEIHTENFFSTGSTATTYLEEVRENYPLSAHSVGLSLGSADPVDKQHLKSIKSFVERFEPSLISDHLSWGTVDNIHLPDLLPLPYTEEALAALCRNISMVQDFLGRQILLENPSSYLSFTDSPIPEWEFLVEASKKTGCGILLDINNIYVSAHNHGFNAEKYIEYVPIEPVQEIHLAGYSVCEVEGHKIFIDDHGARVYNPVWELFEQAVKRFGDVPTLIEWDTNVPELSVLIEEKVKAEKMISSVKKEAA